MVMEANQSLVVKDGAKVSIDVTQDTAIPRQARVDSHKIIGGLDGDFGNWMIVKKIFQKKINARKKLHINLNGG